MAWALTRCYLRTRSSQLLACSHAPFLAVTGVCGQDFGVHASMHNLAWCHTALRCCAGAPIHPSIHAQGCACSLPEAPVHAALTISKRTSAHRNMHMYATHGGTRHAGLLGFSLSSKLQRLSVTHANRGLLTAASTCSLAPREARDIGMPMPAFTF